MKKKYEVSIHYRGNLHYIVEADSDIEAETIARTRWDNGENGDVPTIEFEEIDRIGSIEEIKD